MTDAFDQIVARHRARIAALLAAATARGGLRARNARDPGYRLLLSPHTEQAGAWRVTSFRDGQPLGHREYDVLTGRGPVQDALAEFAGPQWEIEPPL